MSNAARATGKKPCPSALIAVMAHALLVVLALETLVAIPALSWELFLPERESLSLYVGVIVALFLLSILFVLRDRIGKVVAAFSAWPAKPSVNTRLWVIWMLGLLLRLVWVIVFPVTPASDSATYLSLAHKLIAGQEFQVAGLWAYWPPGYALVLSLWLRLPLQEPVAIATLNLVLYSLTLFAGYRLAERFAGRVVGVVAALLIALWPSMLMTCGVASKELFVIALLTLAVLLFTVPDTGPRTWLTRTGSGLCFGAVVLTQPSLMLFPVALLAYEIIEKQGWRRVIVHLLPFVIGAAIVVGPWTLRNEQHFGRLVLISTNGGENFYRANNPLATGGYTTRGEIDLENLDELEASRLGYKYGIEWIVANPSSFLRLSFWKQVLFLGDDSYGAYETLRRNSNQTTNTYILLKGLSNLFWLGVWTMLLYCIVRISPPVFWTPGMLLCLMALFYLWGVHSVFESSSKYHLPVLPFLAILISNGVTMINKCVKEKGGLSS